MNDRASVLDANVRSTRTTYYLAKTRAFATSIDSTVPIRFETSLADTELERHLRKHLVRTPPVCCHPLGDFLIYRIQCVYATTENIDMLPMLSVLRASSVPFPRSGI